MHSEFMGVLRGIHSFKSVSALNTCKEKSVNPCSHHLPGLLGMYIKDMRLCYYILVGASW